jgi:hypothetical protein
MSPFSERALQNTKDRSAVGLSSGRIHHARHDRIKANYGAMNRAATQIDIPDHFLQAVKAEY